jgi:hypothetical protein
MVKTARTWHSEPAIDPNRKVRELEKRVRRLASFQKLSRERHL